MNSEYDNLDEAFNVDVGQHLGIYRDLNKNQALIPKWAMKMYYESSVFQGLFPDPFYKDRTSFAKWLVKTQENTEEIRESLKSVKRTPITNFIEDTIYNIYKNTVKGKFKKQPQFLITGKIGDYIAKVITKKLSQVNYKTTKKQHIKKKYPFGVNVIGYMYDSDAQGIHARSILKMLKEAGVPVAYVAVPGHPEHEEDREELKGVPNKPLYSINLVYTGATQLYIHDLLDKKTFENRYNIGFLWADSGNFPQSWKHACGVYNEIWAGSEFVKNLLSKYTTTPIKLMPLPIYKINGERVNSEKYTFLFVFDSGSSLERKNPQAVIEAYKKAFYPDFSKTRLIIKSKSLEMFPEFNEIRESLDEVNGILINKDISKQELGNLYNSCDAYISLHRAEGYGATMAEAMLLGKPVIATGYSGNMDFMTEENSYPVKYKIKELENDVGFLSKGSLWAEADIDDASRIMKIVFENQDEAKQKAIKAKDYIENNYSHTTVLTIMLHRLKINLNQWRNQNN